ncbi:MAG: restriction endonuclease [Deltaproteobacteria bacterium]|nr:restriction endonuclease [Deltaproteobacteria bacterium]
MGSVFFITLFSLIVGSFLILLIGTQKKKDLSSQEPLYTPKQFAKLCLQLVEQMKLEVGEISQGSERQTDIYAKNNTPFTGGRYIIHCLYLDPNGVVPSPEIIEFSNLVLQERASKGLFITTGTFTSDLSAIGELAPLEFLDGARFQSLVREHRLPASSAV